MEVSSVDLPTIVTTLDDYSDLLPASLRDFKARLNIPGYIDMDIDVHKLLQSIELHTDIHVDRLRLQFQDGQLVSPEAFLTNTTIVKTPYFSVSIPSTLKASVTLGTDLKPSNITGTLSVSLDDIAMNVIRDLMLRVADHIVNSIQPCRQSRCIIGICTDVDPCTDAKNAWRGVDTLGINIGLRSAFQTDVTVRLKTLLAAMCAGKAITGVQSILRCDILTPYIDIPVNIDM